MTDPPQTLCALLEESSKRYGDRLAVIDGALRMSYAELAAEVRAMARALMAVGVQPGDRVAVWLPNTAHWLIAALGAHSAGASLVPMNTRYTGYEALDVLRRTGARVLFLPDRFLGADYLAALREAAVQSGPAHSEPARSEPARSEPARSESAQQGFATASGPVQGLPQLELAVHVPLAGRDQARGSGAEPAAPNGVASWERMLERAGETGEQSARDRAARVRADDVADIIFTSGTTGVPKGAVSTHRQTVAVAAAWADRAEVTEHDVYLIVAPFFHTFGYKAGWVVALLCGATILPQLTFDIERVVEQIERERVTILPGPPTIFQELLASPQRDEHDLSSLRLAVTGAAMVPVALVERMRKDLTFETILTAYGLTEAVVVTMCRPGDDAETISATSGCATADFEIRIAGADGQEMAPEEDGEILLRGPNVMVGYLDDPAATRGAIEPDGWLHTGDVGHLDKRGYLTITDRLKDMFTVGGFNVYPAEVENVIMRLSAVADCAVVGTPDERLGEVGLAYVVTAAGQPLSEQDVVAHCRERLANFKVPRAVVFISKLPRNAGGKVLKRELRG
ncbi:MAG TPA: AMP-binding protein [Streptosporangiaceae bacterium]|nr:AMP-binding protein [Streptosporangiaceae bacterium]